MSQGASVSSDSFASAYEAALRHAASEGDKIETAEEIQQIYSFAAGDINTEVWFVALGSELANNGGIKAFLAEHAPEMRGAVIVNLEALGGGTLSYLEREGDLSQAKCSPRMKRFIKKRLRRRACSWQALPSIGKKARQAMPRSIACKPYRSLAWMAMHRLATLKRTIWWKTSIPRVSMRLPISLWNC